MLGSNVKIASEKKIRAEANSRRDWESQISACALHTAILQVHSFESSNVYISNSHFIPKIEMQVCPPGLHISSGIFYRLFQLMEEDMAITEEEDSRERGGPSYSNYMSDSSLKGYYINMEAI